MTKQGQFNTWHVKSPFNVVALLKTCIATKDLQKGLKLHAYIQKHNCLGRNPYIGSTLISMYAKCGALAKAHQVLKELPVRDVVSWNALIAGYAHKEQGEEALKCVDDMLHEGLSPTVVTFVCGLKACGNIRAAAKGKEIHDKIASLHMLEKHTVLGNSLIDMYVKCNALVKAQQVLEELPIRDAVSWSSLIAGYVQQGQGEKALRCFDDMLCEGHSPDAVTFACVLKACGGIRAAVKGAEIHDKIVTLGMLTNDIVLGNSLVDMYVKCGTLAKAQQVLKALPIRDAVSWNVLIAGYAGQEQGEEALKCFDEMLQEGHSPNAVTFLCALKACRSIAAATKGEEIHEKIVNMGMLENHIVLLGNSLVEMYVKCGTLGKAQQVLKELPDHDVVSWNALIAGYVEQGLGEEALRCVDEVLHEGHSPTVITFMSTLKACGSIGAIAKGKEIHAKIVGLGMLENHIMLGNSLVEMYVKCGLLPRAQQVLEELPARDIFSWNALIVGYAQKGQGEKALKCFDDMQCERHSPNAVTFACALKACGSIIAVAKGEEIHEKTVSLGMLEKDVVLGNAVVGMYVKCGAINKAHQALKELPFRDVVSWNVLIAGYAQKGQGADALKCFDDMLHERHSPNGITFACVLKACGSIGAIAKGEEIHKRIVNIGMLEKDIVLGNSLVDMYVKCGALVKAQVVLKGLPSRDVVSWFVLIAGYVHQGQGEEALKCFEDMLCEGHSPDAETLACVLKACGNIGAAARAEEIYDKFICVGM